MENIRIKELPINDRPRERLINNGVESLSNEELLAIVLKTGTKDMSAKVLSSMILKYVGDIQNLKNITYHELTNIKGVGTAKACMILSFVELSRRINSKMETIKGVKLNCPKLVFDYYQYKINTNQERVYCIYLDASKRVIKDKLLFVGTVNHSLIHPRDIFKEAYLLNASSIICVHNHPSGDVHPSGEDINVTNRLRQIGILMGIKLVDHIIISETKYYSFLENGKI